MKIDKEIQLRVLLKALNYLKFQCSDEDSKEFAGSPIINEIMINIISTLKPLNEGKGFFVDEKYSEIETYYNYIEHIKQNIRLVDNWQILSTEIKREHIITLISPLKFKDETLFNLIEYGDMFHKKSK